MHLVYHPINVRFNSRSFWKPRGPSTHVTNFFNGRTTGLSGSWLFNVPIYPPSEFTDTRKTRYGSRDACNSNMNGYVCISDETNPTLIYAVIFKDNLLRNSSTIKKTENMAVKWIHLTMLWGYIVHLCGLHVKSVRIRKIRDAHEYTLLKNTGWERTRIYKGLTFTSVKWKYEETTTEQAQRFMFKLTS